MARSARDPAPKKAPASKKTSATRVRRHVDDAERRARVVVRQHLAGTAADVVSAVRSVAAVHSSDPLTPYLALWARVAGFARHGLDHALYEERSLWRLHAMRRTLFVVPSDDAPIFVAGAANALAPGERRRLEKQLAAERDPKGVGRWLTRVEAEVLALLADGNERRTQDLSKLVPELATEITIGSGNYKLRAPLATRLLFLLAMEGRIARSRPSGSWRSSQYHWIDAAAFGSDPAPVDAAAGRRELARRYLATHGPATLADLRWWTGWSARHAVAALTELGAVAVDLDSGEGWVLASDSEPVTAMPSVTLLPSLDPSAMGWSGRDWYLGPHRAPLFDRNGNVGPTVWVSGRIVGGWAQRDDGTVVARLLEDVGAEAARAVQRQAEALTTWMGGVVAIPRFRTPLERELAAGTST